MQNTTLLYLIKKDGKAISEVCLAMKKRSFGIGKWNGVGGKLELGESLEEALLRETKEEIGITPKEFSKRAELGFIFSHKPEWNQIVNVYFCDKWEGEPAETEEMMPRWFSVGGLPVGQMWPSDSLWLGRLIEGEFLKGEFVLQEDDSVVQHNLESVANF